MESENRTMTHSYSSTPMPGKLQNPGYEYLIGIYWMKDAQIALSSEKTRYYLPAKALLSACLAIDGYVNVVGSKVDPQWETIDEESTPIKERLSRIYQSLNLPLDFNRGIWGDVLLIFRLRENLRQFELGSAYNAKEDTLPPIFQVVAQNYPIRMTHSIAEEAIELLLSISE